MELRVDGGFRGPSELHIDGGFWGKTGRVYLFPLVLNLIFSSAAGAMRRWGLSGGIDRVYLFPLVLGLVFSSPLLELHIDGGF